MFTVYLSNTFSKVDWRFAVVDSPRQAAEFGEILDGLAPVPLPKIGLVPELPYTVWVVMGEKQGVPDRFDYDRGVELDKENYPTKDRTKETATCWF